MKISRMAEENMAPEWVFDNKQTTEFLDKETVGAEEINRIASFSCVISDDEIVAEKDRIEVCASANKPYYYNSQWPESVRSELKEYATVCSMDMSKFRSVDPSSMIDKITVVASDNKMVKTASAEPQKLVLNDPFKLDDKLANTHEKTKWHPEESNALKLAERPTMNGIVPIRGGEDYFSNSESKVARGQNSISDPNAIGHLAESTEEDSGSRLRRQQAEKEAAKEANHKAWEQDKIEAMSGKEILPNRRVFPTESLNAQPGIKGDVFDFSKLPEKTAGEQLKDQNDERKKQIRGEEKGKYEFAISVNPMRSISEDFGEELKKHLGQMD